KLRVLPGTDGPVLLGTPSIEADADGNTVFFRGRNETSIRQWDLLQNRELPPIIQPGTATITSLAVSKDGLLAASALDGRVTLWDIKSRALLHTFVEHRSWVPTVVFSGDGSLLASASADQTIMLYDPKELEPLRRLKGHRDEV